MKSLPTLFAQLLLIATASAQNPLYVVNTGGNTVTVVNPATNAVTASIPVSPGPTGLDVSPDGSTVYVACTSAKGISVIDTASNRVTPISLNVMASQVALTPNGTQVYVLSPRSGNFVTILDVASRSVVATIKVGSFPSAVAFSSDGSRAYIANQYTGTVSVIDTLAKVVVNTFTAASGSSGLGVTQGGKLYVANSYVNTVSVLDASTGSPIKNLTGFSYPAALALSPDGSRAYVANATNNSVSVIDTSSDTTIATIPVGLLPMGLAVSEDGTRTYAVNQRGLSLSVIDTALNSVTATIPQVGVNPAGVATKRHAAAQAPPPVPPVPVSAVTVDGQALAAVPFASVPTVFSNSTTAATVTWQSTVPAKNRVLLMVDIGGNPTAVYPAAAGTQTVQLTGLIPNTKYAFYIVQGDRVPVSYPIPSSGNYYMFQTRPIDATRATDFRIDIEASPWTLPGTDLYVTAKPVLTAGPGPAGAGYLYISMDNSQLTITPASADISALWMCNKNLMNHDPASRNPTDGTCSNGLLPDSGSVATVRVSVGPHAQPGTYTISGSIHGGAVSVRFSRSFAVLPLSIPSRIAHSAAPPIPNKAAWESMMLISAKRFCDPSETMYFGYEGQIWYYDGARVFLQVADHFAGTPNYDSKWIECAKNIGTQYATKAAQSGFQGWRIFADGISMLSLRYGDPVYAAGVKTLATGSAPFWGNTLVSYQRETALGLMAIVKNTQLTGQPDPNMAIWVDSVIGHCGKVNLPGVQNQPFYDGLGLQALIQYYEYTESIGAPDQRIPRVVKMTLDWLWDNAVVLAPGPSFGFMDYDAMASNAWAGIVAPNDISPAYSGLTNLVAPAFAWYWNRTGDDLYLQRGDFLFSHALDQEDLLNGFYNGKQASQNGNWSFDYIWYREHVNIVRSLSDPSNNVSR